MRFIILIFALTLAISAQSQTPTAGLSANPTTITAGNSTTLTWKTTNCVKADLNGASVPLNGSLVVSPKATVTYRITCYNASGANDWGSAVVTVNGVVIPPPPPTNTIYNFSCDAIAKGTITVINGVATITTSSITLTAPCNGVKQ